MAVFINQFTKFLKMLTISTSVQSGPSIPLLIGNHIGKGLFWDGYPLRGMHSMYDQGSDLIMCSVPQPPSPHSPNRASSSLK